MEYLNFAKRIEQLRLEKGFKTQKALADWLGMSTSIVSNWERGEKVPSMDTALKVSAKFGCNAEWLLTGNGEKYRTNLIPAKEPQLIEPGD